MNVNRVPLADTGVESAERMERVSITSVAKGSNPEEVMTAIRSVAEACTDFSWLSRGDRVFIKVAANSGGRYPATTSQWALRAMIPLLFEKGAGKVIVGDKAGVEHVLRLPDKEYGSTRDLLTRNGLHTAGVESGAEVHYFEEAGYDAFFGERPENGGNWKNELMLPNIVNEVDHIVLLPRVSRHVLTGCTHGLKSAVGWLRDDTRLELHRDARTLLEKCAEINNLKTLRERVRLSLSVATKVQTTFGPDTGFPAEPDPGLIFGSESIFAHDMAALGWLLWNRDYCTPAGHLAWYRDLYVTFPGLINRYLVLKTWGLNALLGSETYDTVAISSVRSDPMLSQAASMWGGWPNVEFEDVGGTLPGPIRQYLETKAST